MSHCGMSLWMFLEVFLFNILGFYSSTRGLSASLHIFRQQNVRKRTIESIFYSQVLLPLIWNGDTRGRCTLFCWTCDRKCCHFMSKRNKKNVPKMIWSKLHFRPPYSPLLIIIIIIILQLLYSAFHRNGRTDFDLSNLKFEFSSFSFPPSVNMMRTLFMLLWLPMATMLAQCQAMGKLHMYFKISVKVMFVIIIIIYSS